jgi:hypothetical protein
MSDEDKAATNGHGLSKITALLPGAGSDAEQEEIVSLLTPEGEEPGVFVIFGFLDGQTRAEYHRVAERNSRRGKPNYDMAIKWLFKKKCKRIEGLDDDPMLNGLAPLEFFVQNKDGNTLMNLAIGEYLSRQIGSAADSSKSR